MRKGIFVLAVFVVAISALGCVRAKKMISSTVTVGFDPTWSPLALRGKEANMTAFMQELMREAAKRQGKQLRFVAKGTRNLPNGLEHHEYDVMLMALTPRDFHASRFNFSASFFNTGPVLVVRQRFTVPEGMQGKFVGVSSPSQEALAVQAYPGALIRFYHKVPVALDEVIMENLDGVMVGTILAHAYIADFFAGQLRIASKPLGQEGIRLVTLKGEHAAFLSGIEAEVVKMKKEGVYNKLLRKWGLMPTSE